MRRLVDGGRNGLACRRRPIRDLLVDAGRSRPHGLRRTGPRRSTRRLSSATSRLPHESCGSARILRTGTTARAHPFVGSGDARRQSTGGNTYRSFLPSMIASSSERLALKRDLRVAPRAGQFVLHYHRSSVRKISSSPGFEALVRWQHPILGLLPPDHFIGLAEETGAIDEVGAYVFKAVCRQLGEWDACGARVPRICVNISARQFERPGLKASLEDAARNGNSPARIELELTETSMMRDITGGIAMLHELKSLGVRLSVDDFGTGYTSLSYLRRFPIDVFKIDKAFLRDMLPGSQDEAIVKAIVTLASNFRPHLHRRRHRIARNPRTNPQHRRRRSPRFLPRRTHPRRWWFAIPCQHPSFTRPVVSG